MAEPIPPDALLVDLPAPMPELARTLQALVLGEVPDAIERVRPGWRVIGYDVPLGRRRTAFFAWILPQAEHVHLGFPRGVLLHDPDRLLGGVGEAKLARWLTAVEAADIDAARYVAFVGQAASIARMPGSVAMARAVAAEPPGPAARR